MAVHPDLAAAGKGSRGTWLLHGLAVGVVLLGVAAQLIRPLAPDLGPPPPATTAFDDAFLQRAQAYRQPLYVALAVALMVRVAIAAAMAVTRRGRGVVRAVIERVGPTRPARAAATVIVGVVVATDVVLLPLVFWSRYVHDGNYGLRTQGLGGWFYDWVVSAVPVWIGVGVLVLLGYTLARRLPATWVPVGGLAVAVLGAGVTFASPLVLEPLSYRFTPLPPGAVRAEVESVLAEAGEAVDRILVADASRRSIHQNAYISGVGTSERVVLFDTLVNERPPAEVGIVLAHELGHHRANDIGRIVLLGAAGAITGGYALSFVLRRRVRQGRQRDAADPAAAAVVLLTVVLLNLVSMPMQSLVSRRAEAAADLASLEYTNAPEVFRAMQRGLTVANLSEPSPPAGVTLWWGSHPTPMARLHMAQWWEQR